MTAAAASPGMSKAGAWKLAVRLPTLTAAVAPVAAGTGVAIHYETFDLWPALAALFGALCLQVGANFANDVFDFKRGADTSERLGPPRVTQLGLLSQREVFAGMWLMFGLAFLAGIYLVTVGGWPIVIVGLASILAAIVYTGGPWPIGYHALGDLFAFVFFGLVAVLGTYYVQADELTGLAWAAGVAVGCTVTAILVVNNLRDIDTDRTAGKTTLAVIMGRKATRAWFALLVTAAILVPIGAWLFGPASPWVLVVLLAVPFARGPVQAVLGGTEGRALNVALKSTARLHLVVGLLVALGMAVRG
ncbi:MAG TPA: 1,4-dihydroxy-2-naphthoate polyprenyltransferase [Tepidiformaceae bacterium]